MRLQQTGRGSVWSELLVALSLCVSGVIFTSGVNPPEEFGFGLSYFTGITVIWCLALAQPEWPKRPCIAAAGFIMDDSHDMATRLEMNNLYGNFLKAFYTLFEITHSGSWPSKVRPVIEKVNPWYAVLFCSYIALVVFAVIRIVTALFLQETLSNAANDADMLLENSRRLAKDYQDKLEELFRAADNDGDGSLTPDEFVDALSIPGVQRC